MAELRGMPPGKAISTPSGFVQCSTHNVRRKAECCEMKAILNADMEVIDYICVCKHPFTCKSASERQSNGLAGGAATPHARDRESSGATQIVIDASSTSMTAHSQHHRHAGQPSAAGTADREARAGTLFAVSFYDASCNTSAPSASTTSAAVPPELSAKDGDDRGGEYGEGTKANAMTISDSDTDDVGSLGNAPSFTTSVAPATAATTSFPGAPRERPRYYDSVQNANTGGTGPPAKVCWGCGMPGHEKPACPNTLCRTCHQKRGPYGSPHRCMPVVTPSPFIVYPTPSEWRAVTQKTATAAGELESMEAVRCVSCNEYGHFDCSTVVLPSSYTLVASSSPGPAAVPHTLIPTCCFCGVRGHTVFDCQQRENANADFFERRNRLFADSMRRGSGMTVAGASFSNSGSNSNYGHPSQQQYQQRINGSPTGEAPPSSSSFTRYGNGRGGGGGSCQRRERDWCDNREQRMGGNEHSNSRRGGGAYCNDSYGGDRDHQRRRYEPSSFSRASGGSASPSSSLMHGRDRFQEGSQRQHEGRSRDSHRASYQRHPEGDHRGGGPRGHGQRSHYSQHSHHHGSSRRGSYRGDSGYYSDDNLF